MKHFLLLAGAFALTTSAALAQTTVPAGTVPGTPIVTTPDMRNAGSPHASSRDEKAPDMSHRDEKRLRKMAKVKSTRAGTKNAKMY
ncbi:MAG: hypothetical protein EOO36_01750 [Cytophagaceae bacterium]|nr:MAG: hypothetical protein EOO36_01750 [Cytophagaceae bacterium]